MHANTFDIHVTLLVEILAIGLYVVIYTIKFHRIYIHILVSYNTCIASAKTTCPMPQGRSKHLETGPDVNTVKLHPLIN